MARYGSRLICEQDDPKIVFMVEGDSTKPQREELEARVCGRA